MITPFFRTKSGVYMANIASAKKAARQAVKRRALNGAQRSELRTAIKEVRKAIAAGDKAAARVVFQKSVSTIDSIADRKSCTRTLLPVTRAACPPPSRRWPKFFVPPVASALQVQAGFAAVYGEPPSAASSGRLAFRPGRIFS